MIVWKIFFVKSMFISTAMLCLIFVGIIIVDPYFHYHKPINGIAYKLDNERYQNYGIAEHFDYNALIIGTSMTQNFKTSEMDDLFDCNSIKLSFSGGGILRN